MVVWSDEYDEVIPYGVFDLADWTLIAEHPKSIPSDFFTEELVNDIADSLENVPDQLKKLGY